MSPFWRALLVGFILVAVVLLGDAYGRALRGVASAAWRGRQPLFSRRDVRGGQWLLAIGASLLSAAGLFAILVSALPAPGDGVSAPTRGDARESAGRSANEAPHRPQELRQDSDRAALARAEVRREPPARTASRPVTVTSTPSFEPAALAPLQRVDGLGDVRVV